MSNVGISYENKRTPRICLIDDDAGVLRAMTRTLEMGGYNHVHVFTSWMAAKVYLQREPAELLILDVLMPEISGLDALSEARKRWPLTTVLMVTGVNEVSNAVECMKRGAADYLTKPVGSDKLIACVNNLVLSRKLLGYKAVTGEVKRTSEQIDALVAMVQNFHPERLSVPESGCCANKRLLDLAEYLVRYIRQKEIFSDPELTLRKAAFALETNTSYLSRSVNGCWGINFRTLLNSIRLAVFLKIAWEGGLLDYTIEGLANSVGFSRPATFYSAFKEKFGITPAKWIKQPRIVK